MTQPKKPAKAAKSGSLAVTKKKVETSDSSEEESSSDEDDVSYGTTSISSILDLGSFSKEATRIF